MEWSRLLGFCFVYGNLLIMVLGLVFVVMCAVAPDKMRLLGKRRR